MLMWTIQGYLGLYLSTRDNPRIHEHKFATARTNSQHPIALCSSYSWRGFLRKNILKEHHLGASYCHDVHCPRLLDWRSWWRHISYQFNRYRLSETSAQGSGYINELLLLLLITYQFFRKIRFMFLVISHVLFFHLVIFSSCFYDFTSNR